MLIVEFLVEKKKSFYVDDAVGCTVDELNSSVSCAVFEIFLEIESILRMFC